MINIHLKTIGQCFSEATERYADNDFLVLPSDHRRAYYPDGLTLSYAQAAEQVDHYARALKGAGYGHGHRVAVLLGNRPEMLLIKLALNSLGISWVPLNPDYRPAEAAYVLQDSAAQLTITTAALAEQMQAAIAASSLHTPRALIEAFDSLPIAQSDTPSREEITPATEASLLYTSGTTGEPKGCILGHEYELMQGAWYCSRGDLFTLLEGKERIYNPLPLFHINAGVLHLFGTIVSGNCQIIPERFSRSRWWPEIRTTRATGMHYLGVVIPALMNAPEGPHDKEHTLRWGLGAGVEPTLHAPFEERFAVPLIEVWGMTEMCRILANNHEPRQTHTRAMGIPQEGLDVRVVDEDDHEVPIGEPGEMLIRYNSETPRRGAFSGYLNLPEATEEAWRGGWFHTGDTVRQDADGMLYFVDRKKNIIRRSGENIAAAEIEACLQAHPLVAQVAVMPVEDEMRDEEVMACVVINEGSRDQAQAKLLFDHTFKELAYYKAPGWLVFLDSIPITGTQKIQKHAIFGQDEDPRQHAHAFDFRSLKKR